MPVPTAPPLYHYRARVTAVHDGDTCTVDIDLGLTTGGGHGSGLSDLSDDR